MNVTVDQLAERRREAQLASLAEKATEPFLRDAEENVLRRMVNYGRARESIPIEKVWMNIGELTAIADLRMALKRTRRSAAPQGDVG